MPFPWLQPTIPDAFRAKVPEAQLKMHRDDVRTRARILMRLGHTRDAVVDRCQRYVAWEFDGMTTPAVRDEVAKLVDEVFSRK